MSTHHLLPGRTGAHATLAPTSEGRKVTAHGGPATPGSHRNPLRLLPWLLVSATIAVQIAFPFTDGGTLALTVVSVTLLASASIIHLATTHGAGSAASLVVIAGGGGLVAEAIGVRTGFPFGTYLYTDSLGWKLLDVPVLVPLAWIMMAWPALAVTRRLIRAAGLTGARARAATPLVGAYALTAWDVFLDPQMVDQGHWAWRYPTPSLPGVADIPLTNFAGWLLVSFLMLAVLDRLVAPASAPDQTRPLDDGVPVTAYLWTYFSSVMAQAVFFGRPTVAVVGGLLMGAIALPLLMTIVRAPASVIAETGRHRAIP
ncbi:carotenoid biosynthesis protein [Gordonia aurantiaca]|uniref:carotenoid biosynthesis protein n=1 Tax=Gordonia sp. B21 TaxID=3151852 RepID=UPI003267AAF2